MHTEASSEKPPCSQVSMSRASSESSRRRWANQRTTRRRICFVHGLLRVRRPDRGHDLALQHQLVADVRGKAGDRGIGRDRQVASPRVVRGMRDEGSEAREPRGARSQCLGGHPGGRQGPGRTQGRRQCQRSVAAWHICVRVGLDHGHFRVTAVAWARHEDRPRRVGRR